jgi:CheY-like chemotaxis protein
MSNSGYIIIADDNKFFSGVFKAELEKVGHEVKVVENGLQVLEAVRKDKPALILLDLIMPEKDGFDTLRELKADPEAKDIKVIVFSNLSQDEDIKKVSELGADGYIVKHDLIFEEAIKQIEKLLKS